MRALFAAILVVCYLALALVPLAIGLAPPTAPGRDFLVELSIALGFVALGQVVLQFGLIARFRRVSRPLGIDLIMQYHRQIGLLAVAFALIHPAILVAWQPSYARMLLPPASGGAVLMGWLAAAALVALVVLSLYWRPLGVSYEVWRVSHGLLGIAALGFGLIHVLLSGSNTNATWKYAALTAWSVAVAGLFVYLRLVRPLELARRPWRVSGVRPVGADTWEMEIAPEGHAGLAFAPGQFAWLKVGGSPWRVQEHPFSFSSSAERVGRLEFGIKSLGDFTSGIGRVASGTRVLVDGPHGSFSSDFRPARPLLLVAGGIGISPMLSILRTLADRHDPREIGLVYACHSWERMPFRAELAALTRRLRLEIVYVLEQGPPDWTGPTGFVTRDVLADVLRDAPASREVFVCGPDAMMTSVERLLRGLGVPRGQISLERFHLV